MEQILTALFTRVWNMSITAGYCIAAVFLLRLALWKMPRKYLYMLWLTVAFRLVCPVSVSTEFSLFNLVVLSGYAQVTEEGTMEYIPVSQAEMPVSGEGAEAADTRAEPDPGTLSAERTADGEAFSGQAAAAEKMQHPLTVWLLNTGKYIWLTGMFLFLVYFAGNVWSIRRRVRMAVRTEYGPAGAGRKKDTVQVYECDEVFSPFVLGVRRPGIYLPCGLQGEERELVLLHERYHIHRKDHLVKLFSFGLLAVYWFHPLVWAAWRGMCRDMEMSCDEKVLEQLTGKSRKAYGMALLSFAEGGKKKGRISPAFGEHDVKRRICHVLNFKKPAVWTGALAVLLAVLLMALLGTNGREWDVKASEAARAEEAGTMEERLYEAANPYVGDASANGRLIGVIAEALPDSMAADAAFTTRLQTSEEPYEFHFMLTGETALREDLQSVYAPSILMLALTDNLGVVQWYGAAEKEEDRELLVSVDVQEAEALCQVEDLKAYSESSEKIRELLELLKQPEDVKGQTVK